MRFRLTYDGPLRASGNKPQPREKWTLREAFHPQLAALWATHPVLSGVGLTTKNVSGAFLSEPRVSTVDVDVTSPHRQMSYAGNWVTG